MTVLRNAARPGAMVLAFVACLGRSAFGDEAEPPAPVEVAAHPDLVGGVEAWAGLSGTNAEHRTGSAVGEPAFGAALGALGSVRWKVLRAGVTFEAATHPFNISTLHLGLVFGPVWEPLPALRFEVLAEGGWSYISDVASDLFVNTSGETSASLPYAGARASVAWRFGRRHTGLLGLWIAVREDLTTTTLHPIVQNTFCLGGCSPSAAESWTVGGYSFVIGARIGFDR